MTRLNDEQLEHFHQEGYVVVEDVIDPEGVLDPLEAEYGAVLDNLARELHEEGAIPSTYDGIEFGERLTRIYQKKRQGPHPVLRLLASTKEHHV